MSKIMKFILLFLLGIQMVNAQYTLIPDTNFEQVLIDQNIDSEGILDGRVLTNDINSVEILTVNNKSISSLDGIEDFVMLKELYCMGNWGLDIVDMSSNLLLEVLEISYNFLTSVDITQNTALRYFGSLSPGSMNLTSIDFTNNTLLKTIIVSGALENIDLSNNILLEILDCSNNQLTSLDVSNNTALKVLDFGNHYGDFGNENWITSIDLSNNPNLEFLNCSGNLLNLDVSLNFNLHTLIARKTAIISFDLSQNYQLTYLEFSYYTPPSPHPINTALVEVDIRNGSNGLITYFNATLNPNLSCIYVDDSQGSYLSNWQVDVNTTFVETEVECSALAIKDYDFNGFDVFPNPTNGIITIDSRSDVDKVIVYNYLGEKITIFKTTKFQFSNTLKNGIFWLAIHSNNEITIKKVILNR